MTRIATTTAQAIRRFHKDEAGNETLQTVFITAIGALVMFGLYTLWDSKIKGWVTDSVDSLQTSDFTMR